MFLSTIRVSTLFLLAILSEFSAGRSTRKPGAGDTGAVGEALAGKFKCQPKFYPAGDLRNTRKHRPRQLQCGRVTAGASA